MTDRDLPDSAFEAPKPESRALTVWTGDAGAKSFAAGKAIAAGLRFRIRHYWPYGALAAAVLGVGVGMANVATAPALTDGLDEVAAIDARQMGLAAALDADGQRRAASSLSRDVGALKSEIARLQRALDQSKQSQAVLTKTATGQAAANQDEVRSLKATLASLQKTLDQTRDAAAQKIDALQAKLEQPKPDDARVAELRDRLDRIEAAQKTPQAARRDEGPETTGSVDDKLLSRRPAPIVKDWVVREVSPDGVALLEGRSGVIEVVRGARAPGMGRIQAIERRDNQWVVVTDRGVVLPRAGL